MSIEPARTVGGVLDLIVRGGLVADGSGGPLFAADVLVDSGAIVDVGRFERAQAERTVDARNKLVTPGFIEIRSHSDFTLFVDPTATSAVVSGCDDGAGSGCTGPRPNPTGWRRE
jgi:N-acyl-D-amino-acid deacylase